MNSPAPTASSLLDATTAAPVECGAAFSSPLVDTSKLDIRGGVIHYKIRQQDDSFVEMTVQDNPDMRRFVSWVQIHD